MADLDQIRSKMQQAIRILRDAEDDAYRQANDPRTGEQIPEYIHLAHTL